MSNPVYNLRPLPGGRRGTSGADAGCDSMRSIGDEKLNRRASIAKSITAGNSSVGTSYRPPPSTSTSNTWLTSVAQETPYVEQLVPTVSTKRKKWPQDMNEFILRTYLYLTNMETDIVAYLSHLHTKFLEKYPHMQVSRQRVDDQRLAVTRNKLLRQNTIKSIYEEIPSLSNLSEQRIADHRRAIINNKYITIERLEEIKQDVAKDLQIKPNTIDTTVQNSISENNPELININLCNNHTLQVDTSLPTQQPLIINNDIEQTFKQAIEYYSNINPTNRSLIPKQKSSKKLAKIINYINEKILPEHINKETEFKSIQTIICCAAWTAAKLNGAKIQIPHIERSNQNQERKPKWQIRLERKIKDLRRKIGRLTQYMNGNRSRKLTKHVEAILERYKIHSTHENTNTNTIAIFRYT
nr:uncharacterized protein LOC113396867 [Vanessa tameamea]